MDSWQLDRLTNLLPEKLLIPLLQLGILAGGSVVYVLCPWVKLATISDLDFFFTDKYKMKAAMELVSSFTPPGVKEVDRYYAGKKCVRTIHLSGYLPIQFILTTGKNPAELISSFDLDYVQCALHISNIYGDFKDIVVTKSNMCSTAHKTRKISQIANERYQIDRLEQRLHKAMIKGFTPEASINTVKFENLGLNIYGFREGDRSRMVHYSLPLREEVVEERNDWIGYYERNKGGRLVGEPLTREELLNCPIFPFDRINYEFDNGESVRNPKSFLPLEVRDKRKMEIEQEPRFVSLKQYLSQKVGNDDSALNQQGICIGTPSIDQLSLCTDINVPQTFNVTDELGDVDTEIKDLEERIRTGDLSPKEKIRLQYKIDCYKLLFHQLDIKKACAKAMESCRTLDLAVIGCTATTLKQAKIYIDTAF